MDNGLGALSDAISCEVEEERNGAFELTMQYPITGIHYEDIQLRRVILAKSDPYSDAQPFRVYRITKPMSGRVTVYAEHISYDLSGIPVSPFTANSAAEAMLKLKSSAVVENPFTFYTDKATAATMTVVEPSSIRSLLGGNQGSLLDVYGGEYEFDRWNVKLLNQRGANNGVSIRYGKNLTDLEQDENISSVATGVYPYWKDADGNLVTLPEKVVDAPGTYDFVKVIPLDLSSDFEERPSVEQLRNRAQKYMDDNKIGIPKVSIEVSFQPLEQTGEYKDIALLEKVRLCDTVNVEFPKLGVSATAKCVKTTYDVLKDRYISVDLGDARTNIADTIAQQQQEIKDKPSSSMMQAAIVSLTATLLGAKGGAVKLSDENGDGLPDTLFLADSDDLRTAQKVWRFNYEGWGASKSGVNGPYTLGATFEDGILADFIRVGTLTAILIKSLDGSSYWDLASGKCKMTGSFEQYTTDGKPSVKIKDNSVKFYAWHKNGDYTGEIGSLKGTGRYEDRTIMGVWCDSGDVLHLGYKIPDGQNSIKPIFGFDSNSPGETPYIANTVSGTLFKNVAGGGIVVEHGLIKDWNMSGTANGAIFSGLNGGGIQVKDGLVTSWNLNGAWSGTVTIDTVKMVFKNGLLTDAINL